MTVAVAVMSSSIVAAGAAAGSARPAGDSGADMRVPGIADVVAAGTRLQRLASGLKGTEGVIAMADGSVLFCEFNANRIVHIDSSGHLSTYLEDSNRPIGLGFDARGRLIAAESLQPRIEALTPRRRTLADSFAGQPLVRPNDVVVDRKGGIYFTDPIPNPKIQFREPPPGRKPLLFYITPAGKVSQLTDAVAQPNGIELSPDGKILYAVDGDHIVAFDVHSDGMVGNPRMFAEVTGDGLAMDDEGRLYAATRDGVEIFSMTGKLLGLIRTPTRIQSIAFGGAERSTLYAVGGGAVYRLSLLVPGVKGRAK
jgi:gluconolactonase